MVKRTVAEALVALASQDQLGEQVAWGDVCAAITALVTDPVGPRDLRNVVGRLNNPEVCKTLSDWFLRRADERRMNGMAAERSADRLLKPLERASAGIGAAGLIGLASGAIGAGLAFPVALLGGSVFVASAIGGWVQIGRRDNAHVEADAIARLADISDLNDEL